MTKRSRARFYALGINGVGVALMIVVFAHTGGLVGAEIGVAGGALPCSPSESWRRFLEIRPFGDCQHSQR